jgi:hypothetical protein
VVSREARAIGVSGWTSRLDQDFVIPLAAGWNLVANPYAFVVDTLSVVYPPGASHDLIGHGASGYAHEQGQLEPGRGYFLWHGGDAGAELRVRPVGIAMPLAKRQGTARSVLAQDESGWSVEVSGRCGSCADLGNRFGQRPQATAGVDAVDLRDAPPPPGGYVSVSFVGEEGAQLYTDYRSVASAGEVWTLRLVSDQVGQPYEIEFSADRPLPAGWRLVAVDMGNLRETELWSRSSEATVPELRGQVASAATVKTWRLIAGPAGYVEEAREQAREEFNAGIVAYALGPLSPNPLRAHEGTVVSLAVPQAGVVSLRVYDLRGRQVAVLHEGMLERGLHQFVWSGTDAARQRVSSGIYLVRLQAPGVRLTKKATVIR